MTTDFLFQISPQPDDSTCGPTCLQAVYRHYGDEIDLNEIISEIGRLEDGSTLAVFLGAHALKRGYKARIYTYNLQVFDPTWFRMWKTEQEFRTGMISKLEAQKKVKQNDRLHTASDAYIEFFRLGGEIRMEVLNVELIRKHLINDIPILTGLSATFLYSEARERNLLEIVDGKSMETDDIGGEPLGHFVVLCGYDSQRHTFMVADPLDQNPIAKDHLYAVDVDRVFSAIILGEVTYNANLLIIEPKDREEPAEYETLGLRIS